MSEINFSMHEECGVCGVWGNADASHLVYLGLTTLQHRGQESAGIVSFNGKANRHTGMGLVPDVFKKENLSALKGPCAIGHVRYSTTGSSSIINAQPLLAGTPYGQLAIAHNGNLTNAHTLKKQLEASGSIFQTTTDSEVILHLIAKSKEKHLTDAIKHALRQVEGAYSLLFACEGTMIAVRDPLGFRPLVLGRLKSAWVAASETCAFDLLGAKLVHELDPGEMVVVDNQRYRTLRLTEKMPPKSAFCIFEYIYFARPDSKIFGRSVYEIRREMGRQLAKEAPPSVECQCVIAVPDSSVVAAIGYAEASRLPFEIGFIRSHYVGRTFIEPSQPLRDFRVKMKFNPIRENLVGKKIVLIDDSIVRGTTSRKLVRMLKASGVREIHMRIASPPITGPCHYGIDTPTKAELIGSTHSIEEIRRYLGVTTLQYLSVKGLLKSAGNQNGSNHRYCTGCFTGNYPTRLTDSAAANKCA